MHECGVLEVRVSDDSMEGARKMRFADRGSAPTVIGLHDRSWEDNPVARIGVLEVRSCYDSMEGARKMRFAVGSSFHKYQAP